MDLLVGLDFDNTIAGYDHVFARAAMERGWLPAGFSGDKRMVRDALRLLPDGETRWMALQGEVYGPRMNEARLLDGADTFLCRCRKAGARVLVISHKTERGHFDPTGTDLRQAARVWMDGLGFFSPDRFGLAPGDVYFHATRDEKVARIAQLGCQVFVDDLEEVLEHPAFPPACRRIHLSGAAGAVRPGLETYADWHQITDAILGR
jgi:hypothetical protein